MEYMLIEQISYTYTSKFKEDSTTVGTGIEFNLL